MNGEIFIKQNGVFVDASTTWGITAGAGFADALCAPPSLKEFPSNASRLEHGKHVITTAPRVESREITLIFQIKGKTAADFQEKKRNFVTLLQGAIFDIKVPALGNEIYHLIYTKSASYAQSKGGTFCKIGCKFIEPDPTRRT